MEKTTVYLTPAQKAALARTAAAEGRSEAHLIRAGIEVVTARHLDSEPGAKPYGGATAHEEVPVRPADDGRHRWISREAFVRSVLRDQADPELRAELRELAPDTTDDLVGP